MRYTNPPLDAHTLLANLKSKGLVIDDEEKAIVFLGHVSYFRFADSQNTIVSDFKILLRQYPMVDVAAMGFPEGWQDELMWR